MSNMYELARQLQAPGVATTATFNPTRLTMTLRNMVRKSIATGYHKGGWSSKSRDLRKLIFKIADETPLMYVKQETDYMTLNTPRPVKQDMFSEIVGMLEADCTLQKMRFDDLPKHSYSPSRDEYFKTIDRRHLENIEKLKVAGTSLGMRTSHYIIVRQPKLRQQIADTFLKDRTIDEINQAERIAKYLDENTEFFIPLTHNF